MSELGMDKDDNDEGDDPSTWCKLRDILAKGNATVHAGETADQPLVVEGVGRLGHETFIGANTAGLWADVGDKKCSTCDLLVNALT